MKERLVEVIKAALENGSDPAEALMDHLAEKDSHITLREARRLVRRLHNPDYSTLDYNNRADAKGS